MILGIAGVGTIGGALRSWLLKHTQHQVLCYDPRLGYTDAISQAEALFICVPVPTVNGGQDLSYVDDVLTRHSHQGQKIFIRSTVLPGTSDRLATGWDRSIYSMPEFLTARKALQDVERQDIICGAHPNQHAAQYAFLSRIFGNHKSFSIMSNVECELAKYMHNVNGMVKVLLNNKVYQLCRALSADYEHVRHGALMSGYVSREHTEIPGPDGQFGAGGICYPKDTQAFIHLLEEKGIPCKDLKEMQNYNSLLRDDLDESFIW